MKRLFITLAAAFAVLSSAEAQVFVSYRPVYFIGGVPVDGPVDKTTANLKFQISSAIPLWRGIAGREGLDMGFAYTQTSIWDFFDESLPFRENVFIPGFYLSMPLQRDRLEFGMEHRSNGRPMRGTAGDNLSRSVNYLYGTYGMYLPGGFVFKASLRGGFGWYDEELTQEVFWRYLGYADFTVGYQKGRWQLSFMATPTFGPFDCNIEAGVAYRLGPCSLFVQFNRGYGEALSDWVRDFRPAPYLRFGLLLGSLL